MNAKVWLTTSRPLDQSWRRRPHKDIPKEQLREVVGPVTVYLHHRGSRRAIGTMGGKMGMITAFLCGLQSKLESLTQRGLGPSRVAYAMRHSLRPMFLYGAWIAPVRHRKSQDFHWSVAATIEEAERSERYWDDLEAQDASSDVEDPEASGVRNAAPGVDASQVATS